GWARTPGRAATAPAARRGPSQPPVASSTPHAGAIASHGPPRGRRAAASWGPCQGAAGGRPPRPPGGGGPSKPTNSGAEDLLDPRRLARPGRLRARKALTPVRARGRKAVTPQAPLRSPWTCGCTVWHGRETSDGNMPTSPSKDTRLFSVAYRPFIG